MIDDDKIEEILARGNTAEVKKTKNGVIILEVARKIRYNDEEELEHEVGGERKKATSGKTVK